MSDHGISRPRLEELLQKVMESYSGKSRAEMKSLLSNSTILGEGIDDGRPYWTKIIVLEDTIDYIHVGFEISAQDSSSFHPVSLTEIYREPD